MESEKGLDGKRKGICLVLLDRGKPLDGKRKASCQKEEGLLAERGRPLVGKRKGSERLGHLSERGRPLVEKRKGITHSTLHENRIIFDHLRE